LYFTERHSAFCIIENAPLKGVIMENDSAVRVKGFVVSGCGITVAYSDESIVYFGATIHSKSRQMTGLQELYLRDRMGNLYCHLKLIKGRTGKRIEVGVLTVAGASVAVYWEAAIAHVGSLYAAQKANHTIDKNTWSAYKAICSDSEQVNVLKKMSAKAA
jgi:hypothetical protein